MYCCDGSDEYDGTVVCPNTCIMGGNIVYQRINYDSVASNMDALNSKKTKHGIKMVDATHKPSGFGLCPDGSCYCSRLFPAISPAHDEKKKFTMNKFLVWKWSLHYELSGVLIVTMWVEVTLNEIIEDFKAVKGSSGFTLLNDVWYFYI
ncbi:hypothetical protein OROGR_026133 [Orobanche gracilis]